MQRVNFVKGCKAFVTNMLYYDTTRRKYDDVLTALFALRDDTVY